MKKLKTLVVASALLLTVGLASCNQPTTSSSEEVSSSVAIDYAKLAKQALAQVAPSLSKYASTTGATASFDLVTATSVIGDDGKTYDFTIRYSADAAYAAYLKVSDDGKKALVTNPNSLEGGVDQKCALKAEAVINGNAYANENFNVLVKAVANYTIKMLYSAKDGDAVSFKGIVTGLYGADYGTKGTYYSIFVGDGDYGVTVFSAALPDGGKVGDYVSVAGTVSLYSNLTEIKSATLTAITAADAPSVVTPTALAFDATTAPEIAINMASRPASITQGLVTSVAGSVGGNITVKVKVGSTAYTVFENSTYCAADDYGTFSQTRSGATAASIIAVNDIIDVSGFTSFYTTPQLVSAKITKWTEGVAPKDTPITIATLTNSGWDTGVSSYVTQGYVTGYYSGIGTPAKGIFISDGDAGLDVYGYAKDCSAFPVGTCVTVVGVPSVYNGLIEFTANSIVATATADITAKAAVTAELAGKTGLRNSDVSRQLHVTGIVAKSAADNNKGTAPVAGSANATVTLTIGNGESINVYLPKWFDATTFNAWVALAAGDEVEATGFLANYKSNTTTWSADLTGGVQIVSPTIVKTTAAASIVKATPTMTVAGAVAAAKGAAVDTIGYFNGSYVTSAYQGIYLADGSASYLAHGAAELPLGLVAGTALHIVGTSAPYNGLPEVEVSKGSITVYPQGTVATSVLVPADPLVIDGTTVAPATSNLNAAVTLSGASLTTIKTAVVAGKTNGTYILTKNDVALTLYVNKAGLEAAVYTALASAVVGNTISLNGFVGCYNTAMQIVNPSSIVVTAA